MDNRLQGKIAVVTAAAQGIGKSTALRFAEEGAKVYAIDINEELVHKISSKNIQTEKLDVVDGEAIKSFCAKLNRVDILFNCAGFVHTGTILDCDEEDWNFSSDLNLKSMYYLIRELLPKMIAQKSGSIINMSSVLSSIKGGPNRFAYGVTKAGVIGMTKSVAADFIQEGVRCNAICPGTIHTPSWEQRVEAAEDPVQAKADFLARQPMGRLGTPEEIAHLAVYLASDESAFTTGQIHVIDGGWAI